MNERGFAPLAIIAIVVLGIVATVYLVLNGQNFFPSAQYADDSMRYQARETNFILSARPIKYMPENGPYAHPLNMTTDATAAAMTYQNEQVGETDLVENGKYSKRVYENPGYLTVMPGEEFSVDLLVRSDSRPTVKFEASLTFPTDILEVARIEPTGKETPLCNGPDVIVEACTSQEVRCAKAPCPPQRLCNKFPSCKVPPGWVISGPSYNSCVADLKRNLGDGQDYSTDSILVGFQSWVSQAEAEKMIYTMGFKYSTIGDFNNFKYVVVNLPGDISVPEAICKMRAQQIVSSAEPNWFGYATGGTGHPDSAQTDLHVPVTTATASAIESGTLMDDRKMRPIKVAAPSFITTWNTQKFDNKTGAVEIRGETSSEYGLFTPLSQPPVRMATIVFRAKKTVSKGQLTFAPGTGIFTKEGTNMIIPDSSKPFTIIVEDQPVVACDPYIPQCKEGEVPMPQYYNGDNEKMTGAYFHCPVYKCMPAGSTSSCSLTPPTCKSRKDLSVIFPGEETGTCNVRYSCTTYTDAIACAQAQIDCASNERLVKYTISDVACPQYRCVSNDSLICNTGITPTCGEGKQVRINGTDLKGCLSYTCEPAVQVGTPNPNCPVPTDLPCGPNQLRGTITDPNGCSYTKCIDPATTRNPIEPACTKPTCAANQTLISNGAGANGCESYSCVYIGNQQVSACNPVTSIIDVDPNGNGTITCRSTDSAGNQTEVKYWFGDFNKDGKMDLQDVKYFFSSSYWSGR